VREIASTAAIFPNWLPILRGVFRRFASTCAARMGRFAALSTSMSTKKYRFLGNEKYSFQEGDEVFSHSFHRRRKLLTSSNKLIGSVSGFL